MEHLGVQKYLKYYKLGSPPRIARGMFGNTYCNYGHTERLLKLPITFFWSIMY